MRKRTLEHAIKEIFSGNLEIGEVMADGFGTKTLGNPEIKYRVYHLKCKENREVIKQ